MVRGTPLCSFVYSKTKYSNKTFFMTQNTLFCCSFETQSKKNDFVLRLIDRTHRLPISQFFKIYALERARLQKQLFKFPD